MRREFDWRRPDGQAHRLLAAVYHLQIDGVAHVLCVCTGLTEQREVERQILDVAQRRARCRTRWPMTPGMRGCASVTTAGVSLMRPSRGAASA